MSAYATFGLRLWRELRKRLHGQRKQFTIKDCRQLAWNILYDLGSHTRASFEAAQLVRSKKMSDEEVYDLIKLSRSVSSSSQDPQHFEVSCEVSWHYALATYRKASWSASVGSEQFHS